MEKMGFGQRHELQRALSPEEYRTSVDISTRSVVIDSWIIWSGYHTSDQILLDWPDQSSARWRAATWNQCVLFRPCIISVEVFDSFQYRD
jgi:hypothetical protein